MKGVIPGLLKDKRKTNWIKGSYNLLGVLDMRNFSQKCGINFTRNHPQQVQTLQHVISYIKQGYKRLKL